MATAAPASKPCGRGSSDAARRNCGDARRTAKAAVAPIHEERVKLQSSAASRTSARTPYATRRLPRARENSAAAIGSSTTLKEDMKFGLPNVDTARPPYGLRTLGQMNSTLKY